MDRLIVSLGCDCESSGLILLSATENKLSGWKINGAIISVLSVSKEFKDINFLQTLSPIVADKESYFARTSSSRNSLDICKKLDDIVLKILVVDVNEVTEVSCKENENIARSLESHLAAAHSELSSQASELSDLRQRSQQLLEKFTAAADGSAGQRERLLAAFCQLLNAKKARITELEEELKEARHHSSSSGGGVKVKEGDGGNSDASSGEQRRQQKTSQESASSRKAAGKKRKSPQTAAAAAAAALASSKPAMRRTRSGAAKKARGSGDSDA